MTSDIVLQERFENAKNVMNDVGWTLGRLGLWPVNITTGSQIRLVITLLYHGYRLSMEFTELIMVFGDLQHMIDNLMVTGIQLAIMIRVTNIRFGMMIRQVIGRMNEFHDDANFDDSEDMEIFIEYAESARRFHNVMMWPVCICTWSWYIQPIQTYYLAKMNNQTVPLTAPYRMPPFVDMSQTYIVILVYIVDLPMLYSGSCYLTAYSIHFTFIKEICAQLAILTHKIKKLEFDKFSSMRKVFGNIVERHIQIMQAVKTLDDASHIVLLYELAYTTLLLGLLSYNIMANLGQTDAAAMFNLIAYMFSIVLLVFTNCYMGEYLETEATNFSKAFSECNWIDLPISYQKAFVICMVQAQIPLKMTAGKFYRFSLNAFTSILKSSGAYVSMLREMV